MVDERDLCSMDGEGEGGHPGGELPQAEDVDELQGVVVPHLDDDHPPAATWTCADSWWA